MKCGEPISIETVGVEVHRHGEIEDDGKTMTTTRTSRYKEKEKEEKVDKWSYCLGSRYGGNYYLYVLTVKGGMLNRIENTSVKCEIEDY